MSKSSGSILLHEYGDPMYDRIRYNGERMDILYTHHAQQRMRQRKVRQEEVAETLEDPDEIIPGDNGGDTAIKRYGNREVRVVYAEPEEGTFLIYTVMKPRLHHHK